MLKRLYKHPWSIIITLVVITLLFASQLGGLQIQNSMRMYLPQDSPSYTQLLEMEDVFGSSDAVSLVFTAKNGVLFSADNIGLIRKITKEIEDLPGVDSVNSLTNIDYIYGENASLVAGALVPDDLVLDEAAIQVLRQKLTDWDDMYGRFVISDDAKSTQMAVKFVKDLSDAEKQDTLDGIRQIVAANVDDSGLSWLIAGDPVVSENMATFMKSDLLRLIPLVVAVVLLCLFMSFGTLQGMILPLIPVLMSTIWTVGLMSLLNITFTIVSSMLPVALIAVGCAYGIHVMNHYYSALREAGEITSLEQHLDVVMAGLKSVMPAVILAAITTIVGFVSLVTSPLVPLRSFAVFTAVGIAFSLLLSVTFIPAWLLRTPLKKVSVKRNLRDMLGRKIRRDPVPEYAHTEESGKKMPALYRLYRTVAGNPLRLSIFIVIMLAVSFFGLNRLVVDTSLINFFPADSQLRKDIDFVGDQFAGTNTVYLVVNGQERGDLTKPEILQQMDGLQSYLTAKYAEVGKIVSFTTMIKRMNQVMHIPERPDYYAASVWETEAADDGLGFSSFFTPEPPKPEAEPGFSSFFVDDSAVAEESAPYLDPNIEYSRRLEQTISLREGLAILDRAYVEAGGGNATVPDMVDKLERELNYNGMAYYEIPYDPDKYPAETREQLQDLVTQYLLLFGGSMEQMINDPLEPSSACVTIQLRTNSTKLIGELMDDIQAYAAANFPTGYTTYISGGGELQYVMTNMIISSQLTSLAFALACVFIILALYFRSPLAGLIGCIPLIFTILLNYMAMGLLGINLDLSTSLIASIAVGVGIDYTIHFMTNYQVERRRRDSVEEVTLLSLNKSGKGIVTNAIAVGAGFAVLCLSEFVVFRYIGLLAFVVMATSSVLAMTVIPGILNTFDPKFMRKKQTS